METIILINAALALVEKLLPTLSKSLHAGEITPAQQAEARASYLALRAKADAAFTGPEWDVKDPR